MTGVLSGVSVLQLPSGIAGAMAGMLLADNGADVLLAEPDDGDMNAGDGGANSPISCRTVWDRGKRSVVAGDEEVRRLAEAVDVVIEPGRVDYDSLAAVHPGVIVCSITGYGRGNRHAGRPAIDALVAARMGLHWDQRGVVGGQPVRIAKLPTDEGGDVPDGAEQTGHREGPIFQAVPWNSISAALLALAGISAALRAREITAVGQHVETSLFQGGLLNGAPTWQRVPGPRQDGYRLPYFDRRCPKGFFQCGDGQWLIQWAPIHHAFVQAAAAGGALVIPDVVDAPRPVATHYDAQLDEELRQYPRTAAAFAKFPRDAWVELFARAGLPAQPVLSPEEGLLDPHALAGGAVAEVVDPVQGPTRQVGLVYRMSQTPGQVGRPAPRPGEHTAEVLAAPHSRFRGGTGRRLSHALEGVTVLDLGLAMAGPYGAQTLADLGANVIKVHNVTERAAPMSSPVLGCNRGKRSIALDLKDPRGQAVLHRLIADADVIHHNMRTGVAERLGADYETVRRINPSVVYCHTRGFEATGPRSRLPGNDQTGQALAGTWWEMGACAEGQAPSWHPAALGDFGNGVMSAVAVLQALYHRERTGEGQFVDTSIINLGFLYNSSTFVRADGSGPDRRHLDAGQTGLSALYRLYETADGWLCVAATEDAHWNALARCIGVGVDLVPDPRFATAASRQKHDGELAAALAAAFATRPASTWFAALDAAGVPCEIENADFPVELFDDPVLRDRAWIVSYPHPGVGWLEQAGHLVELSDTPGLIERPAPMVGQHTREVLLEHGVRAPDIDALLEASVALET
jgi:crotonobetainyl-CoA:carnitine CoA-transferase CaiB-like acyl-CoA transferase